MTIYAASVVDTPGDPFAEDPAAALAEDGALLVRDGVIRARGSLAELRAAPVSYTHLTLPTKA